MALPSTVRLLAVVLISAVAGAINSIAGGGTLLTFPALVGLGITPLVANATSTVALWPGSIASMLGYRSELSGATRWAIGFAVPSLIGGGVGAWLLLRTPPSRFDTIVPWLVLGATALFILQPRIVRAIQHRRAAAVVGEDRLATRTDQTANGSFPAPGVLLLQFFVGVYAGYFGAGAGIIMLAALGLIGLTNIHRMNGLKNWGGLCANAVAAITFAFSSLISWPIALAMAVGSVSGGYLASQGVQKVDQKHVRIVVILIGLAGGAWLLLNRH
ncbi:MAG: sulfite exporter TauE/SafE family protein [Acidobacteria bacterium]|nr:sulfite exporter TauE/SafE family protein [Acidobacteriota bacterium]